MLIDALFGYFDLQGTYLLVIRDFSGSTWAAQVYLGIVRSV